MFDELTAEDIKKMEEEIEYRKLVVRKNALEAVKEARAQGDLSENFEYYAAKKDKNQNESRIRYLEKMIKTAKIISTESAEDEVGINNTVTVYFEEEDEEEVYRIVTTVRSNSRKNLISNESPLGKALLGHKVGDKVEVQVNEKYSYIVEIRKIENSSLFDRYMASGKKDKECYTEEEVTADYNVFECYDSQSCKPKFYAGHLDEDFDYQESTPTDETIDGYIKYLEENDDELPDNYYQRRKAS